MDSRISFGDAISDDSLLKDEFDKLSMPQQVTLKAFYGLSLDASRINPDTGFDELDYWAIIQGSFEQDELGYPTKILSIPYTPKEYNQLWAVIGRRAGKTAALQSFIIAYEAALGGHEQYIKNGQKCVIYLVAQKMEVAEMNMPFIAEILKSSPLMAKSITKELQSVIELDNGISILPSAPNIKSQRGLACPVVAMDEVAFWYKDTDSANPDFEVERAIAKAQLQFPKYKRIGISTPWSKEGLLWKYHRAGTEGTKIGLTDTPKNPYKGKLVCFSTTASFENPALILAGGRDRLQEELNEDEEGFIRECLCVFPDTVSGFLGRPLVEIAFDKAKGIAERPSVMDDEKTPIKPIYVCAIDPAFRSDNFGLCILHKDTNSRIVVDMLRKWTPLRNHKLNPREVLQEIKFLVEPYGIGSIHSDQGQLESLAELALDVGLSIEGTDFTGKSKPRIFQALQQLINQQKIEFLDPTLSDGAKQTFEELLILERRLTASRNIQISAPEGKHDDMASCVALGCYKTIWMHPEIRQQPENEFREKTPFELCMATIESKNKLSQEEY